MVVREISWLLNSCWVLRRSVTRLWDREWAKWSYSWPPRDPLTTRILEQSPTTFYTTGTLIFKAKDRPILTNRQWIGYYVACTFTYNQAPLIADSRALNKFKSKLHYYNNYAVVLFCELWSQIMESQKTMCTRLISRHLWSGMKLISGLHIETFLPKIRDHVLRFHSHNLEP